MSKRAYYKRLDELASWDLDAGCRSIINQSTPSRRKLKKRLKRQARARAKREYQLCSKDFKQNT